MRVRVTVRVRVRVRVRARVRVGLTRYEGGAEVEPLRDPLRGGVLVVEALRVGGDERDRGLLELRGAAEGADGREATEGLGELVRVRVRVRG